MSLMPKSDSHDIGACFREYMHLERKQAAEGLSVPELQRWSELKDVLNRHFQPGLDVERVQQRTSVRLPARLNVSFASAEAAAGSLLTNVSRGGLFIETERPLPIGSSIVLRVRLGEGTTELELPGEVVSHGKGLGGDNLGMGVRFNQLTPAEQKQVEELYQGAAQRLLDS